MTADYEAIRKHVQQCLHIHRQHRIVNISFVRDEWEAIESALRIAAAVQKGEWALVPVEPTEEMMSASHIKRSSGLWNRDVYRAMLKSAPDFNAEGG